TTHGAPPSFARWPTVTVPPCSTTIFFTMERPSPVPNDLVVKYGSKMRSRRSTGRPGPPSSTMIAAPPPAPPGGGQAPQTREGPGQAAERAHPLLDDLEGRVEERAKPRVVADVL